MGDEQQRLASRKRLLRVFAREVFSGTGFWLLILLVFVYLLGFMSEESQQELFWLILIGSSLHLTGSLYAAWRETYRVNVADQTDTKSGK